MVDAVLGFLAPHHCYGCGEIGSILCLCCKNDVLAEPFLACVLCGQGTGVGGNVCSRHVALPYQRLWCASWRSGVLEQVIDTYKFQRARHAHKVLAELLHRLLPNISEEVCVVYVPTAPKNVRIRGYDHMKLIGDALAQLRGWQVTPLLERNNNITQHFATSAKERSEQAKSFFRLNGQVDPSVTYLLVDDILTTGSTVRAAAECLVDGGAEQVWVAVLARQ